MNISTFKPLWSLLLLLLFFSAHAQKQVTGNVSSADGETLPGVNVLVKGTTTGTITDVAGNYSLQVPDESSILVFSFVGFETQEHTVNNRTSINVVLNTDIQSLSEIVVWVMVLRRRKTSLEP